MNTTAQDFKRKNQKVIATLVLEDKGQDFTEIDVLENGVILGNSIMFKDGKLSTIGIGTSDGMDYWSVEQMKADMQVVRQGVLTVDDILLYMKDTGSKTPVPWEATTLNYRVTDIEKPKNPNRFINK